VTEVTLLSAGAFFEDERDDADIFPHRPAHFLPEFRAGLVGVQEEQVALVDARGLERRQGGLRQPPSDALMPVVRMHRQVVDEAAPSVMPAEDGADQLVSVKGDEAGAGVAVHVFADAVAGVSVRQADARAGLPQGEGLVVVVGGKGVEGC